MFLLRRALDTRPTDGTDETTDPRNVAIPPMRAHDADEIVEDEHTEETTREL